MSARSRSPTRLSVGMLSNSACASSGARIGVLPRLTTCLGPRTTEAGLRCHDLADHQPVEQHADRRQVLLDARRRVRLAQLLDVGGDVQRLESPELAQAPPPRTSGRSPTPRAG